MANVFNPDVLDYPSGGLIAGERVPGDGARYAVLRPSDGKVAREERGASAELVDRAVRKAREAFRTSGWAQSEPRAKQRVMRKWADLIEANGEELGRLEAAVSVRTIAAVRLRDVPMSAELIRFYGEAIDKIEGSVLATRAERLSTLVREPYGVVAAIAPWNSPMLLATLKIAPAIAAGNAIVLKPSELTPYATLRLAELGLEAGLPEGLISVLPGLGPETGSALVRHPDVDYVSFTGSATTGVQVMCDAAQTGLKPVSLELGGKSPQLVFADVPDLDRVADIISHSVCANGGQLCYAGTRLVVERSIADVLIEMVRTRMRKLAPGPTWNDQTTLAPIASPTQACRLEALLDQAKRAGAETVEGGGRVEGEPGGIFFAPTILTKVRPDNPAVREELFGPVLTVLPFDEYEEGIALADHETFGLVGAVHTADLRKALRAASAIQAGTVWVNDYGPNPTPNAPIGGYKQSGFGKDFGLLGLDKFLKTKNISITY